VKNTVNYTDILKDEIKINYKNLCCHKAIFLAILYFSSSLNIKGNKIHTEFKFREASVFRKILPVIKSLSVSRSDIKVLYTVKNSLKGIVFDINESSVDNKKFMDFLLDETSIINYLENECCFREFLKVIFLINGSIVNPSKQYFLEINLRNFSKMIEIINFKTRKLLDFEFSNTFRNDNNIIYLKKFDNIISFLSFLECSRFIMLLEEKSMLKGIRGEVNRQVNCEINNINRKIECGGEQAANFINIKKTSFFDDLDGKSKKIILERIDNPDFSYSELGELCNMTKSQINYYIKKIERKYLKYCSNLVKSL